MVFSVLVVFSGVSAEVIGTVRVEFCERATGVVVHTGAHGAVNLGHMCVLSGLKPWRLLHFVALTVCHGPTRCVETSFGGVEASRGYKTVNGRSAGHLYGGRGPQAEWPFFLLYRKLIVSPTQAFKNASK